MSSARITKLSLLFVLATTSFCAAQQAQNQPLQITIQQTSLKPIEQTPLFQVELHNYGKEPLHLNLGLVVYPDNVRLLLTDVKGKTITLVRITPVLTGQIGPMTVSLPPGANYSIPVDLANYFDWEYMKNMGKWLTPDFAPGQYTLQATFVGNAPEFDFDTGRSSKTTYWTGTVTSNTVPFTISENAAQQAETQSLQLSIQQTSAKLLFRIDLHNAGNEPLNLMLTTFGRPSVLETIHLSLTDTTGNTVSLEVKNPHASDIDSMGGLRGQPIMTLQPGETHAFLVDLEHDYSLEERSLYQASGQYTLQAAFNGENCWEGNPTPRCWTGTVTSSTVPFAIPAK